MAESGSSFDAPDFAEYRVGDLWRTPRPRLLKLATQLLLGPDCPGGEVVDYRRTKISMREANYWPRLSGHGKNASPGIRRTWQYAASLALPSAVINEVEKVFGSERIRHGVARLTVDGEVYAGPLPEGVQFGVFNPRDDPDAERRTVLARIGPYTTVETITPAFIMRDEGKVLVPGRVEVLDGAVLLRESLWHVRTGTPIV
jgi:hypothetical protein